MLEMLPNATVLILLQYKCVKASLKLYNITCQLYLNKMNKQKTTFVKVGNMPVWEY